MTKFQLNRKTVLTVVLGTLLLVIIIMGSALVVRKCSSGPETPPSAEVAKSDGLARIEGILLGKSVGNTMYGISVDEYEIENGEVLSGESFSKLLNGRYDLPMTTVNKLVEKSKNVFDLRNMRAGNKFTIFKTQDSDSTCVVRYFVYEKSVYEYVRFECSDEKPSVEVVKREVSVVEKYAEGVINSSLYATMTSQGLPLELADEMYRSIYQWSIDFYALQKGDRFRVIYEEKMIDTTCVGVGKIYGAEFVHAGKSIWAISYEQGVDKGYWDQDGNSLKKAFLASPLKYNARVSSRFGMRVHPITRRRNMHNGIDYACPTGTPVLAAANGRVIYKGWDSRGGGNTLKIQHDQNVITGYLHLSRFAKGIANGSRVSQGDVIGYVGSTGMSTGPHLDYRIQKGGKYVDPTKLTTLPSKPIDPKHRSGFNTIKADVMKVIEEYSAEFNKK